ncbi:MAG: hypothetical protein K8R88_00795 [Armatimonadetes bacterium]|nr:hypothetical protein [Armatimonadota bacterium]
MIVIFNELSFHNQFKDSDELQSAIIKLLGLRNVALNFGREVHCSYNVSSTMACLGRTLIESSSQLEREIRLLLLRWLDKSGPFWADNPSHLPDDWYQCNDTVVTGTGLAEAACLVRSGEPSCCVSVTPSNWLQSPLAVLCGWECNSCNIENYWDLPSLEATLHAAVPEWVSWQQMQESLQVGNLVIAAPAFEPLQRLPFSLPQAKMIQRQIKVLDRLSKALVDGDNTLRQSIVDLHFKGVRAWFSDSSNTEKSSHNLQMTFIDPLADVQTLCSWHGKVSTGVLRLHFTDPYTLGRPISLCYVGPKITKK